MTSPNTIRLTKFQAGEVQMLCFDVRDTDDRPQWGTLTGRTLTITNHAEAVSDLANLADIWQDKAEDDPRRCRAGAESIAGLYNTVRGMATETRRRPSGPMRQGPPINPWPRTHVFHSSGEAYDASQCSDDIANGDVLHVPSEGTTAVLVDAWPVAVTENVGNFDGPADWTAVSLEPWHLSHAIALEVDGDAAGDHVEAAATLTNDLFPILVALVAEVAQLADITATDPGAWMDSDPPELAWWVECPDGVCRHSDPFPTDDDAFQWAHWGHACLNASAHKLRGEVAANAQVTTDQGPETDASSRPPVVVGGAGSADAWTALVEPSAVPKRNGPAPTDEGPAIDAYRRNEVARVLEAGPADGETWFRLQVSGAAESRYLNVTADELERIAALVANPLAQVVALTRVQFVRMSDGDPDLSWLDQTDEVMGEGFEARARERREAYARGEWWCEHLHAEVYDDRGEVYATSAGVSGVDSDDFDDDAYRATLAGEELADLAERLNVDLNALTDLPATWVEVG